MSRGHGKQHLDAEARPGFAQSHQVCWPLALRGRSHGLLGSPEGRRAGGRQTPSSPVRPTLRGALSGGPPAGRCQPRWHQAAASAPDRCAPSQRPCGPAVPVLLPVTGPPDPLHELTLVFNPTVRTHVTPRHSRPDPCCGWQGGRSRPGAVPMASVRPAAAVGLRQRLLQRGRKPLLGEPQPVPAGGVCASHSTGRPGACETASPPHPPRPAVPPTQGTARSRQAFPGCSARWSPCLAPAGQLGVEWGARHCSLRTPLHAQKRKTRRTFVFLGGISVCHITD